MSGCFPAPSPTYVAIASALWKYVAISFSSVPVGVFYRYSQGRHSLTWRRWLTQILIKRYFFNRAYYRIRGWGLVDNPISVSLRT